MLKQERARDFLTYLVIDEKQSFSTQKQALNALVFFYREVCGKEEVDLQVKLRQTTPRIPVILRCGRKKSKNVIAVANIPYIIDA